MASPLLLAIAGNIGSGKTTLTRRLVARLSLLGLYEGVEENPYLADFYGDMPRWALPTQLHFLAHRVAMTKDALSQGAGAICDRTCYEDAEIFAANLHGRGAMDGRDFSTYRLIAEQLLDGLRAPDLLVYLRRSPESCRSQIARRGREFEESIPLDYLRDLGARYEGWFGAWRRSPKLLVEAEQYDFLESEADIDALLRRIEHALPQATLPF